METPNLKTGSFPLPKDHWVFDSAGDGLGEPPMPMRMGVIAPLRPIFEKAVRQAAQYAVRCATKCGTDTDIDPDAFVQAMCVGLFGYFTNDGTAGDVLVDPTTVPRLFAPRITLPKEQVKELAMMHGFTEKPQGEGKPDDLHPYVYKFADGLAMSIMQQLMGELAQARFMKDIQPPKRADLPESKQ